MSVTAERLMVEVQADVRDALRKLDQVDRRTEQSTKTMSRAGRAARNAFGATAVASGLAKTITMAKDFDKTIRQVGVQTNQSGRELETLRKLALKMGEDTVFSAKDAGGAMLELAKGGMTSAQIRAGALNETMRLAAAGGLDLSNSASYIVQGLTTYGLKAKDAAQITTALAGGANASTASVESLGQALSQVGPGAVNAGWSIQETVGALAAFDNAGIKGSDAGTSLKTMLSSLVPATDKAASAMADYGLEFVRADGSIKSYREVAQELQEGLGGLSDAERTRALRTIFGSDATRAATTLMRQGAKGAKEMTKATKDTAKTQEMANSAMEGASGAWENFLGAAETAAIKLGDKLLPVFTDAANKGADFISEVSTWGPEVESSLGWTVDAFKALEGPLDSLVSLAKTAGSAWSGLPQPLKELATQAALAAVVMPRLNNHLGNFGTRISTSTAGLRAAMPTLGQWGTAIYRTGQSAQFADQKTVAARTAVGKFRAELAKSTVQTEGFRTGMRNAAGVGGMLALAQGAQTTNRGLKTLANVGGGALMGFSVGGPIGAAIGGTVGLLAGLAGGARDAGDAANSTKASWQDYASTLDQVSGAATRATAAMAFQKLEASGALKDLNALGLTSRQVVNATLGRGKASKEVAAALSTEQGAIDKLNASVDRQAAAYKEALNQGGAASPAEEKRLEGLRAEADARQKVVDRVRAETGAVSKAIDNKQRELWATMDLGKALKGVPRSVKTKVEAMNVRPTMAQVKDLVKSTDDLDRKDVRTLISLTGAKPTKEMIDRVIASAKEADRQKPDVKVRENGAGATKAKVDGVTSSAKEAGRQKPNVTVTANDKASGVLGGVIRAMQNVDGMVATTYVKTVATQTMNVIRNVIPGSADGGTVRGRRYPYGDKVVTALAPGEEVISNRHGQADQFRADRKAGLIPAYAKGGTVGKKPGPTKAQKAAMAASKKRRDLSAATVGDMAAAVTKGMGDTRAYFKKLDATLKKVLTGKRETQMLRKSNAMERRLTKAWARADGLTKRLEAAKTLLEERTQRRADFTETTRQGIASQATVLNAGNSANAIQASLATQVTKVKEWASMLQQLRGKGYSEAVVSQVAEAGMEGGTEAAKALLTTSSRDQVGQINASMATINSVAKKTATDLGNQLYGGGIAAAQGLVRGLREKRGAVIGAIREMTRAMIQTLKRDLKIKSPSKVTHAVGSFTGQGLTGGLLSERKRVAGAASTLARAAIPAPSPVTPAGMSGGRQGGAGVTFAFTTVNPQAEPQSVTTNKALQRTAALGLV